jgi:hypothetical protein
MPIPFPLDDVIARLKGLPGGAREAAPSAPAPAATGGARPELPHRGTSPAPFR